MAVRVGERRRAGRREGRAEAIALTCPSCTASRRCPTVAILSLTHAGRAGFRLRHLTAVRRLVRVRPRVRVRRRRRAVLVDLRRLRHRVRLRAFDAIFVVLDGVGLRFAAARSEFVLVVGGRAAALLQPLARLVLRVLGVGVRVRHLQRARLLVEVRRLTLRRFLVLKTVGRQ